LRQANIVGVVRAYGLVANIPESAAIRKVVEALDGTEIALTEGGVRNWANRASAVADKLASHLLGLAAPDPEKILALGITHIKCLSGVPTLPTT
jgi:hypothetical protein